MGSPLNTAAADRSKRGKRRRALKAALTVGLAATMVLTFAPASRTASGKQPTAFAVGKPTIKLTPAQVSAIKANAEWVLASQFPEGAIAHYKLPSVDLATYDQDILIWPYLANFAAMGLSRAREVTGDSRYSDAAWKWLSWYQGRMDATGFVTDYKYRSGVFSSTGDMDSTDAYAGTFLLAARRNWKATGSLTKLAELRAGISKAVTAIEATQDADGLTWAKPTWKVKYLMDQAETYAGLTAAEELAVALNDTALAARAKSDADRLLAGVEALWNPATGSYDWAVHDNGSRQPTDWSILYSDALQQVWPVAFGMTSGARASALVARFEAEHPNWDRPEQSAAFSYGTDKVGYWPVAGWAFAAAGNTTRAAAAFTNINEAAVAAGKAWPFTPAIAGALVQLGSADPSYLAGTSLKTTRR